MIAERYLQTGKSFEGTDEIVPQRCGIGPELRRYGPPKDGVTGIQREHLVGIILAKRLRPCCRCRRDFVLGFGCGSGGKRKNCEDQRERHADNLQRNSHSLPPSLHS